jgi:quinol-cytochrome oxidoreductase complex cytochrome b subunit
MWYLFTKINLHICSFEALGESSDHHRKYCIYIDLVLYIRSIIFKKYYNSKFAYIYELFVSYIFYILFYKCRLLKILSQEENIDKELNHRVDNT